MAEPYPSLTTMRDLHRDLLRRFRAEGPAEQMTADVVTFVNRASATGVLIDIEDDRWAAQNMIDYWSTMLYRWGHEEFDATLDEYDFSYAPELPDELCPYLGLSSFSEANQNQFFGRQRLTTLAIECISKHRFTAVIGPSGSGKSSLVLAGLLPRLKAGELPIGSEVLTTADGLSRNSGQWHYYPPIAPTAEPLHVLAKLLFGDTTDLDQHIQALQSDPRTLTTALDNQLRDNAQTRTAVLFIDEFEELFTRCQDEEARHAFIANLTHLTQPNQAHHVLLIALHSDYESLCAQWPELQKLLNLSTVRITPPTTAELREVIEKPAAAIGLRFDEGLVTRLLQDVSAEQSALPLLQFTLLRLWDVRDHNRITWDAYNIVGGGRNSLVTTANQLYRDLRPDDRLTLKRLLLRFAIPTEPSGVEVARRRRRELHTVGGTPERIDAMLAKLTGQRLIRHIPSSKGLAEDQFDLVHEALALDWSLFVEWLEEERANQQQRLRLTTAAQQWLASGRERSRLRRGDLLEESLRYRNDPSLTDVEREFLQISEAEEARRAQERLETEAKRLKMAEELAQSEQTLRQERERQLRRQRIALTVLGGLFIYTFFASFVAYNQRNQALAQTDLAQTEAARAVVAESTAVVAQATAVAALAQAQTQADLARAAEAEARQSQLEAQTQAQLASTAEAEARQSAAEAQQQANAAAIARAQAESNALQALAGRLAAQGFSLRQEQTDLALLLSLHSLATADTVAGRSVLLAILEGLGRQATLVRQTALTGHNERVFTVAYSPDGQLLASGGYDNNVRLWNPITGEPIGEPLAGHSNWVRRVVFSPEEELLASTSYDNSVILWDISNAATGQAPTRLSFLRGHRDAVNAAVFIPSANPADGRFLATASRDRTIVIWDITKLGQPVRFSTPQGGHTDSIYALVVTPDGQTLISAGADRKIMFWDISSPGRPSTPTRILEAHSAEINALALSADGTTLASGDDSGVIMLWDVASGDRLGTLLGHSNWILSLDFAPLDPYLISASRDGSLILWDWQAQTRIAGPFTQHTDWVWAARFNPTGDRVASASRDGSVLLWQLQISPQLQQVMASVGEPIKGLTYNDQEDLVYLLQGAVVILPTDESPRPLTFHELPQADAFEEVILASHGRSAAAFGNPPSLEDADAPPLHELVWWPDVTAGAPPQLLGLHNGPIRAATFSRDGQWLASVGCATEDEVCPASELHLWDLATGTAAIPPLRLPNEDLVSIAFSTSSELLGTGGCRRIAAATDEAAGLAPAETEDKNVCDQGQTLVWQLERGSPPQLNLLHTLYTTAEGQFQTDFITQLAFTGDHGLLATASGDNTLVLWEMNSGRALSAPQSGHNGLITAVEFSPDGRILATASTDSTLIFWDVLARQRLAVSLQAHFDEVSALAFTGDSYYLASAGADGQLLEWLASLEAWQHMACGIANRELTEAEWQTYIGVGEVTAVCELDE